MEKAVFDKIAVTFMGYSKIDDMSSPEITSADFIPCTLSCLVSAILEAITEKKMFRGRLFPAAWFAELETA